MKVCKGRKGRGLQVVSPVLVNGIQLDIGDRLSCTPELLDYCKFETQCLPFRATFWRTSYRGKNVCDAAMFRCPLFAPELGTNPMRSLAIDSLHTIYYGPIMRIVSCILWRVLESNPWQFRGGRDHYLEQGCKMLRRDLADWYDSVGMDPSRRVYDFTAAMLGGKPPQTDVAFGGGLLKLKAAETGDLLRYAIGVVDRHGGQVQDGALLRRSAVAILDWNRKMHDLNLVVPEAQLQPLHEEMQRHLLMAEEAGVHFVPKHHQFAHTSHRVALMGNCRFYSTFVDESLNLLLRTAGQFAHRANQGLRIFQLFELQGRIGLGSFLFGAVED